MRVAFLGLTLALMMGAAQADGIGKVPDLMPSDRWDSAQGNGTATVAAPTRDAAILIGCSEGDPSVAMMITLANPLPIKDGIRNVAVSFDDGPPVTQAWFSANDSYGVADDQLAFITTLKGMMSHQKVEFVLSEDGKELDRHSFTLNGAPEAIASVIRTFHQNG